MNAAGKTKKALALALGALCLSAPLAALAHGETCRYERLKGQYIFSASGYTRANLDAPWVPKAIVEYLAIEGDGTMATPSTVPGPSHLTTPSVTVANPFGNTGLIVDRVGSPGTIELREDCTGVLTFVDGNTFRIYMAPRGDEFWMIQTGGAGGSLNVFQGKATRVAP